MYKKILLKTNLTLSQAEIMDFLYLHKEARASTIAKKIKRSRAIVYKDLEELEKLNLIEKHDIKNKPSTFQATHPSNLEKLFQEREKELTKDKKILKNTLPDLISDFNLTHHKPGIKYYEGLQGVKEVLADSLTTKGVILSYADIEAIYKYTPKINKWYVTERKKKKIKKRGILLDTPYTKELLKGYYPEITETRLIPDNLFPFGSIMQIYDNKISYISLSKNQKLGVIIEDKNITQMHRSIFEFTWQHAKKL